jgi:hypothetical protein
MDKKHILYVTCLLLPKCLPAASDFVILDAAAISSSALMGKLLDMWCLDRSSLQMGGIEREFL